MGDWAHLPERLGALREQLGRFGAPNIELVAVSKGHPYAAIAAAVGAGCDRFGESYAQEMVDKLSGVGSRPTIHFIGRLQTNKVRSIRALVDVVESVDRPSLITELAARMPGSAVLIQVSPDGDTNKGGCHPDDAERLTASADAHGLRVDGLMCVGPTGGDPVATRAAFRATRQLVDRLGLAVCSMGMSDDLRIAIDEGSTRVRIGTALFGPRSATR